MPIIDQLREQLEQAISKYSALNPELTQERLHSINKIRAIMCSNNPLQLKSKIIEYIESLSTGILALWPFFEVNRFKTAIREILNSSKFSDNEILKNMLSEAGIGLSQEYLPLTFSDNSVLQRLEILEKRFGKQNMELEDLKNETSRLKKENEFLTKTISMLANCNKDLSKENCVLKQENDHLKEDYETLNRKYIELTKENTLLVTEFKAVREKEASKYNIHPQFKISPIKPPPGKTDATDIHKDSSPAEIKNEHKAQSKTKCSSDLTIFRTNIKVK